MGVNKMNGFPPFGMFSLMGIIVPIFFTLVIGIIVFQLIKGIGEWSSNNKQPILTVIGKVVSKRTSVSRHQHGNDHMNSSTSTTYYVTFEVESGDRIELRLPGKEFGLLAEGDIGKLTFQGTRYHGFERERV